MKKSFVITTKGLPCTLYLTLEGDLLRFRGFCADNPQTIYFSRKKSLQESSILEFPMPVSPERLGIMIYSDKPFSVHNWELKPLKPRNVLTQSEQHDFLKHAIEFCQKASTLPTGVYTDDFNRFPIHYTNHILNRITGKTMFTPARVSRKTGQIEVCRADFLQMTVPMRVLILLHEYSHYLLQSRDEFECDLNALYIYLGYGFPQTEAIYALGNVFNHIQRQKEQQGYNKTENPEHIARLEELKNYILTYQQEL